MMQRYARWLPAAETVDWRDRAACAGHDPELFTPPGRDGMHGTLRRDSLHRLSPAGRTRIEQALAVCDACPVLADCREWAVTTGDPWLILGGTLPGDRRLERVRRGLSATAAAGEDDLPRSHSHRALWGDGELSRLVELHRQGLGRQQIADLLGRTPKGVTHALAVLRGRGELEVAR